MVTSLFVIILFLLIILGIFCIILMILSKKKQILMKKAIVNPQYNQDKEKLPLPSFDSVCETVLLDIEKDIIDDYICYHVTSILLAVGRIDLRNSIQNYSRDVNEPVIDWAKYCNSFSPEERLAFEKYIQTRSNEDNYIRQDSRSPMSSWKSKISRKARAIALSALVDEFEGRELRDELNIIKRFNSD